MLTAWMRQRSKLIIGDVIFFLQIRLPAPMAKVNRKQIYPSEKILNFASNQVIHPFFLLNIPMVNRFSLDYATHLRNDAEICL